MSLGFILRVSSSALCNHDTDWDPSAKGSDRVDPCMYQIYSRRRYHQQGVSLEV